MRPSAYHSEDELPKNREGMMNWKDLLRLAVPLIGLIGATWASPRRSISTTQWPRFRRH